jgi:hypothetical protein
MKEEADKGYFLHGCLFEGYVQRDLFSIFCHDRFFSVNNMIPLSLQGMIGVADGTVDNRYR